MLTVDRIDLFYGAAQALRSVSLEARAGRILTVLGRNGVGKSSLLRAIVGQHMVASGAIRWNDDDMTRLPSHLRAKAGFGADSGLSAELTPDPRRRQGRARFSDKAPILGAYPLLRRTRLAKTKL